MLRGRTPQKAGNECDRFFSARVVSTTGKKGAKKLESRTFYSYFRKAIIVYMGTKKAYTGWGPLRSVLATFFCLFPFWKDPALKAIDCTPSRAQLFEGYTGYDRGPDWYHHVWCAPYLIRVVFTVVGCAQHGFWALVCRMGSVILCWSVIIRLLCNLKNHHNGSKKPYVEKMADSQRCCTKRVRSSNYGSNSRSAAALQS